MPQLLKWTNFSDPFLTSGPLQIGDVLPYLCNYVFGSIGVILFYKQPWQIPPQRIYPDGAIYWIRMKQILIDLKEFGLKFARCRVDYFLEVFSKTRFSSIYQNIFLEEWEQKRLPEMSILNLKKRECG